MRNKIFIITALIICLFSQSLYVYSENQGVISLKADNNIVVKNSDFKLFIYIENIEDIYGFHVKLSFDKNYIRAKDQSVTLDNIINSKNHFTALNTVDNDNGEIELMVTLLKDEVPLNKNTLIGTLSFTVLREGNTEIFIEKSELLNKNCEDIYHTVKEITLTIKEAGNNYRSVNSTNQFSLNGRIFLTFPENLPPGVNVFVTEEPSSNSLSNIYKVQSLYPFNHKVKLSIKLNENAQTIHPGIFYFNEERNKWIYLGGELENSFVSVLVNHFGKFCIMEDVNYRDYKDIGNNWAKDYINRLTSMGIVNGVDEDSFSPDDYVTRAQIAKIISIALDLNENSSYIPFKDQASIPEWAVNHISRVVENEIMIGYNDNTFKPDKYITRAELAVILSRIVKHYNTDNMELFTDDSEIPHWSWDSIYKMKSIGILSGYEDGRFKPDSSVTRAEACKVVVKLLEAMGVI